MIECFHYKIQNNPIPTKEKNNFHDLVLISTTKKGLQKQIDFIDKYCNDWKLTKNVEKTKTVIFNKMEEHSQKIS